MREVLVEQGKLTEAEPLMREELLASREARGARHAQTLVLLSNLAQLLHSQGRLREASRSSR